VNGEVCQHKDCVRTDATPVEFMLNRRGELVDERTFYFSTRKLHFKLHTHRTLGGEQLDRKKKCHVRRFCRAL
jgi:hypothetical protein